MIGAIAGGTQSVDSAVAAVKMPHAMRTRALICILVAAAVAAVAALASGAGNGVLYEGDSRYNHIVVEQDANGVRRLYFEKGGATQSAIRPGEPLDLELVYSRAAMLSLTVVPAPKKVLIVGLGGGAMPMFLRTLFPTLEIEVVELDPKVVEVATRYFGFRQDAHLKAYTGDGRAWIEAAKGGWDVVYLDAYGKGEIPRHLATLEFLEHVKAKLAPGGLVVGNVWEPASNPLYERMVRTYAQVFPDFCVVRIAGSGNRIFFANRVIPPPDKLIDLSTALSRERKLPFELSIYAQPGCVHDEAAAEQPLTDPKKPSPAEKRAPPPGP
jgi:spermidine synthase